MIKFSLKCAEGHRFESWFRSASEFETLTDGGMVGCADCGSTEISKDMMAPSVRSARRAGHSVGGGEPALSQSATAAQQAIARIRREVEANSEYVGADFARKARAMHEGTAPTAAIYGEARADEARALVEDGVPVLPLPFRPTRKVN